MKTKPWPIIILSLLHLFAPLGNLVINAFLNGRSIEDQWLYWIHQLPLHFFLIQVLMPVVSGICILICRRWSYFVYVGTMVLMLGASFYGLILDLHLKSFLVFLVVLVVDLLVVAFFVVPSIQKIYFDSRVRWWEANPRYDFNGNGLVSGQKAHLKTISEGGVFVTEAPLLEEGENVECQWQDDSTSYSIQGIVKYHGYREGIPGMGICFIHTPETHRLIKPLIAKLHAEGKILKERLPGPEDQFLPWIKHLLTTGEGLFPRLPS